jgi:hypothetical protein
MILCTYSLIRLRINPIGLQFLLLLLTEVIVKLLSEVGAETAACPGQNRYLL